MSQFRHHKYCVIEASGLLVAYVGPNGLLNMYLLDGVDDLGQDTENKKVRIADQGLFDYVCANASKRTDSKYRHVLRARITGTVDLDNNEIQLHQVSEAILSDDGRALRYESRG